MSDNSAVRQALLKPTFKHLYPGVVPNEWQPASVMLEQINATARRRGAQSRSGAVEALDPEHFAFRGTSSAGANQLARELRVMKRNRRRPQ
jgi:hypothetical protein